ncbi:mCG147018 [Mus musculus]|nr:mCG147018 [Mus musculus]
MPGLNRKEEKKKSFQIMHKFNVLIPLEEIIQSLKFTVKHGRDLAFFFFKLLAS